jgi:hypothetical protein
LPEAGLLAVVFGSSMSFRYSELSNQSHQPDETKACADHQCWHVQRNDEAAYHGNQETGNEQHSTGVPSVHTTSRARDL